MQQAFYQKSYPLTFMSSFMQVPLPNSGKAGGSIHSQALGFRDFRAPLDVTGAGGAHLSLEAWGGNMSPKGSRLHPSFVKDSGVVIFPLPGWNQLKIIPLKWCGVGPCFLPWPRPPLCSSRALTMLAALGTTPGLQPAPVGGGPLASGLSLRPPGSMPVV